MKTIKTGMIAILYFYATLGEAKNNKKQVEGAINYLIKLIDQKYQLSTTGYQTAMKKDGTFITKDRRDQYTKAAKRVYPSKTLKKLAMLQKDYINKDPDTGKLLSPHHFKGEQLTDVLSRVRQKNFANCEMQAFEAAIHLQALGFSDMAIISNKAISHNYLLLDRTNLWPKGAMVDPWTGYGVRDFNFYLRNRYKHYSKEIQVPQNMMSWIKKNANQYANKAWISRIRKKFFPGEGPEPLKNKLIPLDRKN